MWRRRFSRFCAWRPPDVRSFGWRFQTGLPPVPLARSGSASIFRWWWTFTLTINWRWSVLLPVRTKVRINPGNIGGKERVKAVADACRQKGIPIRIGVNGGSLEKPLLEKYGKVCPEALVESAFGHIRLLNQFDFDDICVSLKSSSVPVTMAAYRLMGERSQYPLHLGVTEAGTRTTGTIKSAIGIGGLLAQGIGDTFRVTLTADPVEEVVEAKQILAAGRIAAGGPNLIACPTCGRTRIDLIPLAQEVEDRLKTVRKPITVAVMGWRGQGRERPLRLTWELRGETDLVSFLPTARC